MPSRQSRKPSPKPRDAPAPSEDDSHDATLNGNGLAHPASGVSPSAPRENIFLFWPNIIGMRESSTT